MMMVNRIKLYRVTGHTTAKGISKVAQRWITHQDYLDTLRNGGTTVVKSNAIRSFSHQLYSVEITKRGLSTYDDKKYTIVPTQFDGGAA